MDKTSLMVVWVAHIARFWGLSGVDPAPLQQYIAVKVLFEMPGEKAMWPLVRSFWSTRMLAARNHKTQTGLYLRRDSWNSV